MFTVKYHPDAIVDRYKAHLIARDFTQTNMVDYTEISLVVRLNFIRVCSVLSCHQPTMADVLDGCEKCLHV